VRGPAMKLRAIHFAAALMFFFTSNAVSNTSDPDPTYDRLDGTGESGKRVNVIEWEGNLEIHVYPQGSLRGLALKIDDRNKQKPVMVIGYRFDNDPSKQLIRRAILSIDIKKGFKVFRDPRELEFDKIIISNNTLASQVVAFNLDPEPAQLYPDGHPANGVFARETPKMPSRAPAGKKPEEAHEEGAIKPFAW